MLELAEFERSLLWADVTRAIETYVSSITNLRVAPVLDPAAIRARLDGLDFGNPMPFNAALALAVHGLTGDQVHTPHPRYYGLFNPAPTTMGIAADTLVAAFNPQLAAWSHSPWAAEVERKLVHFLAQLFGYGDDTVDGTFASGGMEANHTALLCALVDAFPEMIAGGLRSLPAQPVLYISSEAHHSFPKAARLCGLGTRAIRTIPVDERLRMRADVLAEAIAHDRRDGLLPFLVVATAGTTNAGAVDPLGELADVAEQDRLWFHVDAAWGGAAVFLPELRPHLDGIGRSDSITFDAHKWLSVPMGAGVFLTRHADILDRTFRMITAYMPKEAAGLDIVDPHLHSMQWSRRFIGLKVFLSLLVAGADGYAEAIRHQTAMGALLRNRLAAAGWEIANDTPLPVVCFAQPGGPEEVQRAIAMHVVASGEAWISTAVLAGGRTVLRACITNYRTQPGDIEALIGTLERARKAVAGASAAK